ncbi:S41 family peptidase [Maricaulis parjimensis]|uniref:S41 family peptidase n=1 Tax=Maricaulis parjimensis TaxID=144023 RepID=UPI00193A67D3|nr:S41 family peptidase [Maricaulis parjimensis]
MLPLPQFLRPALTGLALITSLSTACAQSGLIPADEARADLETLYSGLIEAEADLFQATPRAVFDARYAELHDRLDDAQTPAQLHAEFQRFAALARHAHTRIEGLNPIWADHAGADGLLFPLRFIVENGEVIITAAPAGSDVSPGDRILALEGEPNPIWLARLTRNISAETPEFAYAQLANGEFYYMLLEYGAREQFTVTVDQDGVSRSLTLDAIPLSRLGELEGTSPRFNLEGREAGMLTQRIAYIRPGPFWDIEAEDPALHYAPDGLARYQDWLDTAFEDFIAAGATDLILDLRDNPGGDNSWSDPVIAWFADRPFRFAADFQIRVSEQSTASNQARLDATGADEASSSARLAALYADASNGTLVSFDFPHAQPREGERFAGRVHVLVNRHSYSNAVTTGALIQDYGFGTVYGEPTRDMATTFGAMEHFTLPHSGLVVGYPKARIIRPNGEAEPHPLTPDVLLPAPAIRGERDVRLEALVARLSD